MADVQQKFRGLGDELQKAQTGVQSNVEALQKLDVQHQENKSVLKELRRLEPNADVYKLVGPVLLKQDHGEATTAVESRLSFIDKEKNRIEVNIKELQERSEQARREMLGLQSSLRPEAGA